MTTYKIKEAKIIDGRIYGCSMTTTRKVTNDVGEEVTDIGMTVVWDGCPVDKMMHFATNTAVIRHQNQRWKKMTKAEIEKEKGLTWKWDELGKSPGSVKSGPSMITVLANALISQGMSESEAIEKASEYAKDPAKIAKALMASGM